MMSKIIYIVVYSVLWFLAINYITLWWPIRTGSRLLKRIDKNIDQARNMINKLEKQGEALSGVEKEAVQVLADFVRSQFQVLFTVRFLVSSYFNFLIILKVLPKAMDPCFHQIVLSVCDFQRKHNSVYTGKNFIKCCHVLSAMDGELGNKVAVLLKKNKRLNLMLKQYQPVLQEYRNHVAAHVDVDCNKMWTIYNDEDKKGQILKLSSDVLIFCVEFVKIVNEIFTALDKKSQH